jgi:hypothetical protein
MYSIYPYTNKKQRKLLAVYVLNISRENEKDTDKKNQVIQKGQQNAYIK